MRKIYALPTFREFVEMRLSKTTNKYLTSAKVKYFVKVDTSMALPNKVYIWKKFGTVYKASFCTSISEPYLYIFSNLKLKKC